MYLKYLYRWCISHYFHCKLCFHMHIFVPFSTHLIWYKSIGALRKMSRLIIICGPIVSILAGRDCGFTLSTHGFRKHWRFPIWGETTIFRFHSETLGCVLINGWCFLSSKKNLGIAWNRNKAIQLAFYWIGASSKANVCSVVLWYHNRHQKLPNVLVGHHRVGIRVSCG